MGKMVVYLSNLGRYNEGVLQGRWLKLPASKEALEKVLDEIGINEMYEEYFITDSESDIIGINNVINEFSNIQKLNELAECLELLSEDEERKLEAILEYESCSSATELIEIIEDMENYDLLDGIDTEEALGYYYADELCCIYIPENIKCYFDYEAYGRDIRLEGNGIFTSYGYWPSPLISSTKQNLYALSSFGLLFSYLYVEILG